jgi:hypothetical protein
VAALVADEVVVEVVVVELAVVEELVDAALMEYTSNLFPAPQYSNELPSQSMLQSAVGANTLPARKVLPQ